MIKRNRKSGVSRFLWGFMALYFLNLSVDSADPYSNAVPEDLSINDQESIVEIITEKVLGFEDAIAEREDGDVEDHTTYRLKKIELVFLQHMASLPCILPIECREKQPFYYNDILTTGHRQLDTPPPII